MKDTTVTEIAARYEEKMSDILKEAGIYESVIAMFEAKQAEIERLREELYEIKLAAAGGEDAPGAANMVTAKDIEKWTKELWSRVRDREAEIERLREALAMAHDHFLRLQDFIPKNGWPEYDRMNALIEIRAALGEGKE